MLEARTSCSSCAWYSPMESLHQQRSHGSTLLLHSSADQASMRSVETTTIMNCMPIESSLRHSSVSVAIVAATASAETLMPHQQHQSCKEEGSNSNKLHVYSTPAVMATHAMSTNAMADSAVSSAVKHSGLPLKHSSGTNIVSSCVTAILPIVQP